MKAFFVILSLYILFLNITLLANEDFKIDGNTLIFDTVKTEGEVDWNDQETLISILQTNEIDQLTLNSRGGYLSAAMEITNIVIDYELDTHVDGVCYSSCYYIFIAGEKRSLKRLSKIGLHRANWAADSMRRYYLKWKDDENFNWKNEFDFAAWALVDGQKDIHDDFVYQLNRGINPDFIVKSLSAAVEEMWIPERKELIQSGIITERIRDYNQKKK